MSELTQERLKKLYHYNPDTGVFTRMVKIHKFAAGTKVDFITSYGYVRIVIDKKSYQAHRLACLWMTGKFPEKQIDHINHIRTDNRWCNLRCISNAENRKNLTPHPRNKSGVTGVSWNKANNKWQPTIKNNGKQEYLGYFNDFFDAVCARKSAENRLNYHPNHGKAIRGS